MRLRDVSGGPAPSAALVRLFTGVSAARRGSLLEEPDGPPLRLAAPDAAAAELPAAGTVTMAADPAGRAAARAARRRRRGRDRRSPPSRCSPGTGCTARARRPAGNLPVAVHLSPARTALAPTAPPDAPGPPGEAAALRLTVACGPAPASGTVRIDGRAAGWRWSRPGRCGMTWAALGHAGWDLAVRARPGAPAGRYFVAARITAGDGQAFEDAVLVSIGEPAAPALDLPLDELVPLYLADQQRAAAEVDLALLTPRLRAAARRAAARSPSGCATAPRSPVRGEAQLVSPFGSWAQTGPWTRGFAAAPGQDLDLRFAVTAPGRGAGGCSTGGRWSRSCTSAGSATASPRR